ncbi:MAG: acyl-CoA dehydrogenase [Rhodospirillales bacterium]|nr:acyl-CoA dehydrogenase [Rhodospirillales bacterium]
MPDYKAPTHDMVFLLRDVLDISALPQAAELDTETVTAILEEAGKLASGVLAPLNHQADKAGGCILKEGSVTTAAGWKDAYRQYCEMGWNGVPFDPEYGGQGLPWVLAFPVQEMWQGANMSFGLCPLLNQGAVEAIESHGSDEQKSFYLPKLVSGEWAGTMNLTEPQAGSDLGAIRSKAEKQADGTYKITGQKIFITYGEHDLTDNIIHLVLARVTGAPEGVKGISLFIVPKFLEDGTRNDLICAGLEHKLGIHASPTCTMSFGDNGGATGYLVGEENQGLKYMFTMMNNARLSVGLQGVAIGEAAYQAALAYAGERVQSAKIGDKSGAKAAIIEHPDVRRMLLTMKVLTQAGRALAYEAALNLDKARGGDATAQSRVDILTPIVKSWCTDNAVEVASLGVQVHGGMGFIEETGAAQFYRDARILPIYEGTNGIQALDLAFRKLLMDKGEAVKAYQAELTSVLAEIAAQDRELSALCKPVLEALEAVKEATAHMLHLAGSGQMDAIASRATSYLNAFGVVCGAVMMARRAAVGDKADRERAGFYRDHILPRHKALSAVVLAADDFLSGDLL